jgi:hypothetical protein
MTHSGPIFYLRLGTIDLVWSLVSCASPIDLVDRPKRTLLVSPHVAVVGYCFVICNMILHELSLDFGMLALLFT